MPNFDIHVDRISFWLGFLAATLFWWLLGRIRPLLPQWRSQLRQYIDTISQRNLTGVEEYLRRETLRRTQRQHLAAPLFSLDEILIQPWLLIPPGGQNPESPEQNISIAGRVLPYLPDWPELIAPYGVPVLTPAQALQSGRHLAIIGQPGSGKTVALAHLAAQISRRDEAVGKYTQAIAMYLHVLDLDSTLEENQDPLQNLVKGVSSTTNVVMQPQIPRYLKTIFRDKQRKAVLFLDGLDELPQESFTSTVAFLRTLIEKYPRLQVIVTASSDYLDGLTKANFYPLGLAAWNQSQRTDLASKWGALWNEQILPEARKQGSASQVDPIIMDLWLSSEASYSSPLEWTMRIWGAYAGDVSGNNNLSVLDTQISRYLPSSSYMPTLEQLGRQMVEKSRISLSFDEMEKILSSVKISAPVSIPLEIAEPAGPLNQANADQAENAAIPAMDPNQASLNIKTGPQKKPGKKARRESITASQGEQILNALLAGGVLVEQANHQIRFASPVFLAFLAGMSLTPEEASGIVRTISQKIDWPVHLQVLQYAAACADNPAWVDPLIIDPVGPIFRNLMIAARWLRDTPSTAVWRTSIMRTLVTLIQNETLPLGTRTRLIAAFYLSRDPSATKLFKQLLVSRSATIRRIALMGCGALGNSQLINDILPLLADPEPEVRYTACLALAATPGESALNAVVEVLLSGDEEIRQAAAEAISQIRPDGHKILEEAAGLDDLLTRRAAVYGLLQVHEPWAHKALEKLAVEDGQWVVRNAAGQALDVLQQSTPAVPKSLPRPSDSPWLLTFASKLGMGILPGQPATDVLIMVLKSGSVEEQIAAMHYLREQPDEGIVGLLYGLLYSGVVELEEPVLHTLWWMTLAGAKLPSPTQFGLG